MFTENEEKNYENVCIDAYKILEGTPGVLDEAVFDYALGVAKLISESNFLEERRALAKHALSEIQEVHGQLTVEEQKEFFNVLQTNIEGVNMPAFLGENFAKPTQLVTSIHQVKEGDYLVCENDDIKTTVIVTEVYDRNPGLGFSYRHVTQNLTESEEQFADEREVRGCAVRAFYETAKR